MNRRHLLMGIAALAASAGARAGAQTLPALPTGPSAWINSPPLQPTDIAGRPVLVEFWTFGCYNCRNTLPWIRRVHQIYAPRGLAVVAVHTPEFPDERDPARVREEVRRLGLTYPVVMDPDGVYWRALSNRYWPAFYLFDRGHVLNARREGELHTGDETADSLERGIATLLAS